MKTGRKQKPYRASTGEFVQGLYKCPDGRWRVNATGYRFTEPNEVRAIVKFRALSETKDSPEQDEAYRVASINRTIYPFENQKHQIWKWLGDQIRERPQWIAKITGIEQIGYLDKVKPSAPPPSFAEIETAWRKHFNKSIEQRRKVLHAWQDFKDTTKVSSINDITPEVVIDFRDNVHARNLGGKTQVNLFTRIRRLFTFAKLERAIGMTTLGVVIENLKLLKPNRSTVSFDPIPIEVADWNALLKEATGEDKAMILLMLNGAFYTAEVIRLKWSEIKAGALVTHRIKEGQCVRACVLWPETIDALTHIKHKGDHIFYSYAGLPLGIKGAEKRFRKIRDAAGVEVTSSQLRDGAATAAASANVHEKLCNLLMGHRCGISDHYVKRNPKMVLPATDAVYKNYFGK